MNRARHRRAKEIFLAARNQSRESRRAYVEEACGGDADLRGEVESLLDVLDRSVALLEPPSSTSAAPSSLPERVGAYRILRKLGEGGMGEVYEAEQEGPLRRTVALKVIKWGMDSAQVVARFESERQALALMSHPAIARVFEAGSTETGRPYFAMEYVPGLPITDYCDLHRLDPRQRLELFTALCEGVGHAHAKGVLHRDIKPSNVLVTRLDGRHLPKLIDFGVAKATALRLTERTLYTELGQWIGTPEYMSPEQAGMGSPEVDARSDVYSLGVVLYELLVGALPFDAQALKELGFDEMRRKIRDDEAPRPSRRLKSLGDASTTVAGNRSTDVPALSRQLRGDLDRIAMKALEKDPERRYASPAELAADIGRYLGDEPVRARPPSPAYRLGKLVRRRRRSLVAAAGTLAVSLLGIVAASLWLGRQPPAGRAAAAAATAPAHELYLQGRQQLRDVRPEALSGAIDLFRQAIELDPSYAPAHAGLAEGYIRLARRGDLPMEAADRQAGAALERALELDPQLAEAHAVVGLLRSTVGDMGLAESALRRAIELDADLAPAHLWLGTVLGAQNRPAAAGAAYRRALELDPLNLAAHSAMANNLMGQGRYDDAILQFHNRLRIEPESTETYRLMALFARTFGRLDDAVRWSRRAVELDPEAPLNLHELIMAYSSLGEFDEAARWMDRAYALAPNNHWTFTLKAYVLIEHGDFEALEAFLRQHLGDELLKGDEPLPQIARVRLALAGISRVYRRDHGSAVELFERALGDPFVPILEIGFDASAFAFLALAYLQQGRLSEAERAMEKCLELVHQRRDWIWAHLIMPDTVAGIYALQGRDDEAVETLRRAVADGWLDYWALLRTPHYEGLRRRSDFQELMIRVEARLAEMRDNVRGGLPSSPGTTE